jgi:hypothetical protein
MLEKDIENLLVNYPDEFIPGEGFKLIVQQFAIEGRRVDILFEDKHGRQIIVEVKRGILSREASGQIAEYYGLLKNADETKSYELILCANIIPQERKVLLETIEIDCKELGIAQISNIANKYGYTFIDDSSAYKGKLLDRSPKGVRDLEPSLEIANENEEVSVWMFQGNPKTYDIPGFIGIGSLKWSSSWYCFSSIQTTG